MRVPVRAGSRPLPFGTALRLEHWSAGARRERRAPARDPCQSPARRKPARREQRMSSCAGLPKLELHCDLDEHVDRDTQTPGGREAPLPHGIDGALIETVAKTAL